MRRLVFASLFFNISRGFNFANRLPRDFPRGFIFTNLSFINALYILIFSWFVLQLVVCESRNSSPNFSIFQIAVTVWKVSKYEFISGPYFPVFGLNTEIYGINIHIHPYSKIRTRNNSVFGHFSRSDYLDIKDLILDWMPRGRSKGADIIKRFTFLCLFLYLAHVCL